MNICDHGQNLSFCSKCNPVDLTVLAGIDTSAFVPMPALPEPKTWAEQFPSGTRSIAEQSAADLLEDIPFTQRKD